MRYRFDSYTVDGAECNGNMRDSCSRDMGSSPVAPIKLECSVVGNIIKFCLIDTGSNPVISNFMTLYIFYMDMMELVDMLDLESNAIKSVRVQVSLSTYSICIRFFCGICPWLSVNSIIDFV